MVHARSHGGPDGPYEVVGTVLNSFAHGPKVLRLRDETLALLHIGCGDASTQVVRGCTNGSTPANWTHASNRSRCNQPGWTGILRADNEAGPWKQTEDQTGSGLSVDGGVGAWHKNGGLTNPSVWLSESNSSAEGVVLAYSEGCPNCTVDTGHKHIGVALGTLGDGPNAAASFEDLTPSSPVFPWASEDPSIFRDPDSGYWHILAHRTSSTEGGGPAGDAVASHAVATSPRGPWRLAPVPPYGRDIKWNDGTTTHVQKRERPQIIVDRNGALAALSNGVRPGSAATPLGPLGFTGDWTYTHVQLIDRKARGPWKTDDVLDLPPGPQFSPAEKQQQIVRGAELPARILAAHAAGVATFRVPPGDYRWPAPATAADTWPLVLESLQRSVDNPFTIDADGVAFWFETRGRGFLPAPHVTRGFRLVNCSHLTLKGLTTDFDPPNTIEGRVTAIDRIQNRMQVELSAGSLFRPPPEDVSTKPNVGRFIPYKSSGEFITPLYALQNTRGLRFASWTELDNSTQRFWATLENSLLLNTTEQAGWRNAFGSAGVLEEGDAVAIMYAVGSAIEILHSAAVTLSGWKNFAAKTGLEETLGEGGHTFEHLVFGKRPGTNRLMGGEGVMSNALRKGSRWRNVSISLTTDDICEFSAPPRPSCF